jgi:hypothetical protein
VEPFLAGFFFMLASCAGNKFTARRYTPGIFFEKKSHRSSPEIYGATRKSMNAGRIKSFFNDVPFSSDSLPCRQLVNSRCTENKRTSKLFFSPRTRKFRLYFMSNDYKKFQAQKKFVRVRVKKGCIKEIVFEDDKSVLTKTLTSLFCAIVCAVLTTIGFQVILPLIVAVIIFLYWLIRGLKKGFKTKINVDGSEKKREDIPAWTKSIISALLLNSGISAAAILGIFIIVFLLLSPFALLAVIAMAALYELFRQSIIFIGMLLALSLLVFWLVFSQFSFLGKKMGRK